MTTTTSPATSAEPVLNADSVVYSADSHVLEPGTLWTEYIEPAFRDRAPHVEYELTKPDGTIAKGEFMVCEGIKPEPVAFFAAADVDDPKLRSQMGTRGYDDLLSGGWDPAARLKDQDLDGVTAEVIFPSIGMPMFQISDLPLQHAVFRAYNTWMTDYCSHAPQRLLGLAMIGLDDVDWAVAELKRARDLGLRGVCISNDPRPATYADRRYDPFWAAAVDLQMPVNLHILTGTAGSGLGGSEDDLFTEVMPLHHPIQITLTAMLTSGLFERHPDLTIVSVENDIGWLAHFLFRLDHFFDALRYVSNYSDPLKPTEYFRRNVLATFQDDPVGVATRDFIGVDRLMWASDYPHGDSTWPYSRDIIERNFQGVDAGTVRQITHDTVTGLYKIG